MAAPNLSSRARPIQGTPRLKCERMIHDRRIVLWAVRKLHQAPLQMKSGIFGCFGILLITLPSVAQAQLVVVDDVFGVPFGQQLVVEAPGVLDNDLYDEEPAVDGEATAELVTSPLFGTLECGSDPGFDLCPDGSFNYTPDGDFPGSDSFTYRAVVGTEMAEAIATLTACDGGPIVFVCWKESL